MNKERPEVSFVTRILTHYRVPFHERVRALLRGEGIDYRLLYGQPSAEEMAKGDLAEADWAEVVHNRTILGVPRAIWQPVFNRTGPSDLVIVGQENQLLVNYPLQLLRNARRKVALFGHGRNFQSRNPDGLAERWKRIWATKCDWWFAYTDETRRHIETLGFPPERITVFENTIDTNALREAAQNVTPIESRAAMARLGMKGANVGIFVGGLYPEKRLDFLVEAAEIVRECVPDFELLVVGGGVEFPKVRSLAESRPWIFSPGPRFGREKAALMLGAKLFLMPGLVGLAVLDAGVIGLPVVTTAFPWHSPEIAYLKNGKNGIIVNEWRSPRAYAVEVARLMIDEQYRADLERNARDFANHYTIENMAERFVTGVVGALSSARTDF